MPPQTFNLPPFDRIAPLPRSFYDPSARVVARRLLGHWLIRNSPHGPSGGPIVETEAYLVGDPASHAFAGRTLRNQMMWGEPGRAYVYLIYGFHHCFNAVCRPSGVAEAVLVRAIEPAFEPDWMRANRPVASGPMLTSGPGKLCAALAITRALDGADLCDPASPIWVAENPQVRPFRRAAGPVVTTTRVGLTQAAGRPLRFYLAQSPFVSRRLKPKKN